MSTVYIPDIWTINSGRFLISTSGVQSILGNCSHHTCSLPHSIALPYTISKHLAIVTESRHVVYTKDFTAQSSSSARSIPTSYKRGTESDWLPLNFNSMNIVDIDVRLLILFLFQELLIIRLAMYEHSTLPALEEGNCHMFENP